MIGALRALGRKALGFCERLGRAHVFLAYTLLGVPESLYRVRPLLYQVYAVGVLSIVITVVSGLFVGMVLALQGYNTLVDFGAANSLGIMVALSLVREIGPLAGVLALPLLATIFSAVGVYGGYFVGCGLLGVDEGAFWSQMQSAVDFHDDVLNGVIKSVCFGAVVTWIAVFEGYDTLPTAEGIGRATTRTVVHSSLAVLGLDFVLTALMFD